MELESFTQCLSYLEAVGKPKDSLGPMIPTVLGIAVGFGLNFSRDWLKSRKENYNKKMCIKEDIIRIRQSADDVFIKSLKFIDALEEGKQILGHDLPREINLPYIEKHFIDVAHLYSEQERHYIVSLMPRLNGLNAALLELYDPETIDSPEDAYRCFRTANAAITHILENCDNFLEGPVVPQNWVIIADRLKVKSKLIEKLRQEGRGYPGF